MSYQCCFHVYYGIIYLSVVAAYYNLFIKQHNLLYTAALNLYFILQDSEVLRAWLTDLRFEEYYDKFMAAGYDMPTISRMTPEDLNAIGITKPAHRKKLKAEITRLNISDGLPDFIPVRNTSKLFI